MKLTTLNVVSPVASISLLIGSDVHHFVFTVKGGTCGPTWGSLPQRIVGWEAAGGASTMRPFVSSSPPWRQPISVRLILPSSRPPSSRTDGVCRAARAVCPPGRTMKSAAEGDHRGRRMLAEATGNWPGGVRAQKKKKAARQPTVILCDQITTRGRIARSSCLPSKTY